MRNLSNFGLVIFLTALVSGCIQDHDLDQFFVQNNIYLTGIQEVPAQKNAATGRIDVTYNKSNRILSYDLQFVGLSGNLVAGHFHANAPLGMNAPVLIPIPGLPASPTGSVKGSVTIPADKEKDLLNGLFYVNMHTAANPGGEIRAQIEFLDQPYMHKKLNIYVGGSREIPSVNSPGWGYMDVTYNSNTKLLSILLQYENLSGIPIGAHIHGFASIGDNAPVVYSLTDDIPKTTSGFLLKTIEVDEIKIRESDLLNGRYYFNLHTAGFPDGEMRGQIVF